MSAKHYKMVIDQIGNLANLSIVEIELAKRQPARYMEYSRSNSDVVFHYCGNNKISAIKLVREITGLGLKEAKDMVNNAPSKIKTTTRSDAIDIQKAFAEIGATVTIK